MKRAVAWFAENHVAANLLMLLIIVAGIAAISRIQQKSFPDIDVEIVQVGVTYLGASPEEVEEGVCIRIEEAIQSIDGIEKLTSTATEGACGVSAELVAGYPVDVINWAAHTSGTSLTDARQMTGTALAGGLSIVLRGALRGLVQELDPGHGAPRGSGSTGLRCPSTSKNATAGVSLFPCAGSTRWWHTCAAPSAMHTTGGRTAPFAQARSGSHETAK